jgi:acetate kinase
MTPAGGVVMGTRSGDLDPGVLLYLLRHEGLTPDALNRVVNETGGLAGLSGVSGDIRALLAEAPTNPRAAEAIDVFCYSVRKAIGALAAAVGGVDTLVFTAGIGEHSAEVRWRIADGLGWLGIHLDATSNAEHAPVISTTDAPVTVRVIATREELMIARHVRSLLVSATTTSGSAPWS